MVSVSSQGLKRKGLHWQVSFRAVLPDCASIKSLQAGVAMKRLRLYRMLTVVVVFFVTWGFMLLGWTLQ